MVMEILGFFVLALILIGFTRWWVWRSRMRSVNENLAGLAARLAAIEEEFRRFRSMQPNVDRETGVSPVTAALVTEFETGRPVKRLSPRVAPVPAVPRGAPAPAKWSWQPSRDLLPARLQLPAAGPDPEPAVQPLPAAPTLMSRLGGGLKSAGAGEEWE